MPLASNMVLRLVNEVELLEEAIKRTRKDLVFVDVVPAFEAELVAMFERQGTLLEAKYRKRYKARGLREAKAAWWHDRAVFDKWFTEVADATSSEFAGLTKSQTKRALSAGVNKGIADLLTPFNLSNPRAQAWLAENAGWMVTHVNDASRAGMNRILSNAREAGYSFDKTAKLLRSEFGALSAGRPQGHIKDRATLIATNETAKAYERGTRMVADKLVASGLVMEKSWLAAGDSHVDPQCASYEDQGFIEVGEVFGGMIGEPPAHPACRCTLLYRRVGAKYAESIEGMTKAQRIRAFASVQPNASLRAISEALGIHYSQVYSACRIGRSSLIVDSGT